MGLVSVQVGLAEPLRQRFPELKLLPDLSELFALLVCHVARAYSL